mgnify:CR=1 FL=1
MTMKADALGTHAPQNTTPSNPMYRNSASGRYVLASALLLVVYLVASWSPAESSMSLGIAPSFALFWLAGGSLTLGILARAAKKDS